MLQKLIQFPSAFADQAEHDHIRLAAAGNRRHQRRLAATRSGEDADTLSLSHRQERVDGANAGRQRGRNARPVGRLRRIADHRHRIAPGRGDVHCRRRPKLQASETVEHAAEQMVADLHRMRAPQGLDHGPVRHPLQRTERRQDGRLVGKSHHFGQHALIGLRRVDEIAQFADFDWRHMRFDQCAEHLRNLAVTGEAGRDRQLAEPCRNLPAYACQRLVHHVVDSAFHYQSISILRFPAKVRWLSWMATTRTPRYSSPTYKRWPSRVTTLALAPVTT